MRCLVTGATGMLGQAVLSEAARRGIEAVGLARQGTDYNVDITDDAALIAAIADAQPGVIINTAALVDLKRCEDHADEANRINARAVGVMADECRERSMRLVQVSTDHFYAGDGRALHNEDDPVTLLNEYARSKHAGEALALTCPGALVLRTNITGFRGDAARPTFAEWLFGALEKGERINAFTDYFTSTLDVGAFAAALFDLLDAGAGGILNVASNEVSDKKTFIDAVAVQLGVGDANIHAASVQSMGLARADSLGLDVSRAEKILGRALPNLNAVVIALVEEHRRRS